MLNVAFAIVAPPDRSGVVLAFFAFVLVALAQADDTRLGLYVVPVWFVGLGAAWYFNRQTPLQQARIAEWKAVAAAEKAALALTR